jgi:CheY-like chemotaxis protein
MKKRQVLWADDDMDDLMLMRHVLQDIGDEYDIKEVHNGREALDYLEAAKQDSQDSCLPCLIILDMNMPVLNGKETLSLIKKDEVLREIPLVFFTTSNSELDKMYCKRFGVEMITKPPRYNNLKEAVKRLLEYCFNKN